MHKLYFKYGTMNCSKTSLLMMNAFNLRSQGKKIIIIKPILDTRTPDLYSRALGNMKVDHVLKQETDFISTGLNSKIDCVFVDEAQFLSYNNVVALRTLTEECPVICYGLKTNYMNELFEGSKALLEMADSCEEIKTVCSNLNCTNRATINARIGCNNEVIVDGNEIDIGTEDKYKVMCFQCWNTEKNKIRRTTIRNPCFINISD